MGTTIDETEGEREIYRRILRKPRLMYGLITSIIGFPVGLALKMPSVWGLALAGIAVGGAKLLLGGQKQRS